MPKFKQMLISNKVFALKLRDSISMPMHVDDTPRAKETESYQFMREKKSCIFQYKQVPEITLI